MTRPFAFQSTAYGNIGGKFFRESGRTLTCRVIVRVLLLRSVSCSSEFTTTDMLRVRTIAGTTVMVTVAVPGVDIALMAHVMDVTAVPVPLHCFGAPLDWNWAL